VINGNTQNASAAHGSGIATTTDDGCYGNTDSEVRRDGGDQR
jgi:hypothetical protein